MGKTQKIVGAVLILLALVLAGYAWVLSSRMAAKQQEAQRQMQPVVVAVSRIAAGSMVRPEMVRSVLFPMRPEGAYSEVNAVAGKITASDIAAGEPLLRERIGGTLRAILQHLNAGERAVAVRVDEVIAVGNRLNPGDLVDVYVTLRRNNDEIPDTQSLLLLEKLQVLAFGSKDAIAAAGSGDGAGNAREVADSPGGVGALTSSAVGATTPSTRSAVRGGVAEIPKTAVLAVKQADVDKLALAAESGHLLLALRPHETPQAGDPAAALDAASGGAQGVGGEAKDEKAKLAAGAIAQTKIPPVILTLRELVGAPKDTGKLRPAAPGARETRLAVAAPRGEGIAVMHGLKEKTVYLSAKKIEAQR